MTSISALWSQDPCTHTRLCATSSIPEHLSILRHDPHVWAYISFPWHSTILQVCLLGWGYEKTNDSFRYHWFILSLKTEFTLYEIICDKIFKTFQVIFQAEKNDGLEEENTNSDVSQIKINHYFLSDKWWFTTINLLLCGLLVLLSHVIWGPKFGGHCLHIKQQQERKKSCKG